MASTFTLLTKEKEFTLKLGQSPIGIRANTVKIKSEETLNHHELSLYIDYLNQILNAIEDESKQKISNLTIDLGKELGNAKITHPKFIPVYQGEAMIGKGFIDKENIVNIETLQPLELDILADNLEISTAGIITERKGNMITGFELTSVSIQLKRK